MPNPADGKVPSCLDCPSYLKEGETTRFFKRTLGSAACLQYGHVLGKPGLKPSQEAKIAQSFAGACPKFGQPRPSVAPDKPSFLVSLPDPVLLTADPPSPADQAGVTSCLGCANFVTPAVVREEFGWPHGLCAAQGRLIPSARTSVEARGCASRTPGSSRTNVRGISLMPVYEDAFGIVDHGKAALAARDGMVSPQEYVTDRPVDAEDAASGIRAWRKMTDPTDSRRFTFLPIFNPDFFDEVEREKIPMSGDDERPEFYVDHNAAAYKVAVLWMELDETPALWGVAGTGKTEFFRYMAWLMSVPFDRISITETSEVDDLAGKFIARADEESGATVTEFLYGRIVKRWRRPGVLLLDEPNTGPDAVWQFVRPLTDNSKQLVLDQHNGEKIDRHMHTFLGMAMNPSWDIRNIGARPIADADGNRLAHLSFTLPPEHVEREILLKRCESDEYVVDPKVLETIMKIAKDVRVASDNGTLPISWGIRPQIKVIRATKWFDLVSCYRLAVADCLEPEAAAFVMEVVKNYVGSDQVRTILVHLNVETTTEDRRTANEIADDLQRLIDNGWSDNFESVTIPLAEEV